MPPRSLVSALLSLAAVLTVSCSLAAELPLVDAQADVSALSAPLPLSLDVTGPPDGNHAFLIGTNDVWSSISAIAACRTAECLDLDRSRLIDNGTFGSAFTSVGLGNDSPLHEPFLVTPHLFFDVSGALNEAHDLPPVDLLENDYRLMNAVEDDPAGNAILGGKR